jgi:hypothetical protein
MLALAWVSQVGSDFMGAGSAAQDAPIKVRSNNSAKEKSFI